MHDKYMDITPEQAEAIIRQHTDTMDWAYQQIITCLGDQPIARVSRACADMEQRYCKGGEPLQGAIENAISAARAGMLPDTSNLIKRRQP